MSKDAPDTSELAMENWGINKEGSTAAEVLGDKDKVGANQHQFPTASIRRALLPCQVVPDLEKFMQAIRDKLSTVQEMHSWISDPDLPTSDAQVEVWGSYACMVCHCFAESKPSYTVLSIKDSNHDLYKDSKELAERQAVLGRVLQVFRHTLDRVQDGCTGPHE